MEIIFPADFRIKLTDLVFILNKDVILLYALFT